MQEDFVTEFNRRVFLQIEALISAGRTLDTAYFAEFFTPEEMGRIVEMRMARSALTDNGYAVLLTCADRLKKDVKRKEDSPEDIRAIIEKKRKGT